MAPGIDMVFVLEMRFMAEMVSGFKVRFMSKMEAMTRMMSMVEKVFVVALAAIYFGMARHSAVSR